MSAGPEPGPALLRRLDRGLAVVEDNANLIAALAIFFLMFVGVAQIVGRTVFGVAIHGYIDWIEQSSALFAFLGIAYAQRLGAHIRMDITLNWPRRLRWWLELFGVVLALVVITLLIDASFNAFWRAWSIGDSTMDIRLPVWPAKLMVPLALSLLWLRLLLQLWGYVRMALDPRAVPVAVPKLESIADQVKEEVAEALGRADAGPRR
jgi:TRAP-type mannitol/chloroaromatic compound transport system permease small subunit